MFCICFGDIQEISGIGMGLPHDMCIEVFFDWMFPLEEDGLTTDEKRVTLESYGFYAVPVALVKNLKICEVFS